MSYDQRNRGFGAVAAPIVSPQRPEVQYNQDFFIYSLTVLALAPAATSNTNIQIQADSDFKLIKLGQMSDIAAAAQLDSTRVIPLVTVAATDTGSGLQLFSAPVAMGALFGDGRLPFILPVPRIFKANTNISFSFTNYDAAVTYNIRMAFIGIKLWTGTV